MTVNESKRSRNTIQVTLAIAHGGLLHNTEPGIESERSEHCEQYEASSRTNV